MIVGDETPDSHSFLPMTYSATDLARHGIRRVGRGYKRDGVLISSAEIATLLGAEPTAPAQAAWSFEKLNAATQAFFYQLCEQIREATKDASMACAARIGKDIPNIGLENAPRLTNLKKAGVIERGERGWVQLTELGRAMFLVTV